MNQESIPGTLHWCITKLHQKEVIAYPTESVFSLGCDPDSEQTVMQLLKCKKRSVKKGLILIAADYQQLAPYISDQELSIEQYQNMLDTWPGSITWVLPIQLQTPRWLTGCFNSLAVRIPNHYLAQELCRIFGKPIISTSANLSGQSPCRNVNEVFKVFGEHFPVLQGRTGGQRNPSEIRDAISGKIIRKG